MSENGFICSSELEPFNSHTSLTEHVLLEGPKLLGQVELMTACMSSLCRPLSGLKQYYKLVQSHPLPHKVFEEKVQHLLELFSKIPFNQALVFSNLHTRYVIAFNAKKKYIFLYLFYIECIRSED